MAVTVSRGTISTVTDITNIKYDISEVIDFLSPTEAPLLTLIGKDSLKFPCTQVKHEWLSDQLTPRQTTLDGAYTAGSGTLTVAAGTGKYFSVDDLILIGNNVLQILSGPPNSDTFIVTGGLGSSIDANAADGAVVRKLGSALPEGSVARMDATKTHLERPYNYTQIFRQNCVLTGTMEVIKRYGYVSERAYQEEKAARQLALDLEHEILYGVRSYSEGPPRRSTMGGLAEYILFAGIAGGWETVMDAGGAQLTEDMVNDMMQRIWEKGGTPDTVLVNGYNQRLITKWALPYIRTERGERMGGAHIVSWESDFGVVEFLLDRWLRPSDVVFLTTSDIGLGPLNGRAFASRVLPSLGDYTQTEVLGEYTMEVHRASMAHGWIYNTATS